MRLQAGLWQGKQRCIRLMEQRTGKMSRPQDILLLQIVLWTPSPLPRHGLPYHSLIMQRHASCEPLMEGRAGRAPPSPTVRLERGSLRSPLSMPRMVGSWLIEEALQPQRPPAYTGALTEERRG